MLRIITGLSHEFGTSDYVCGGGGNTSCKDDQTLWIKPSGTALSNLSPETFIALNRKKLAELYAIKPPDGVSSREALVKEILHQATRSKTPGRASVEAPLHDSLNARYVVHLHPCIINGLACSKNGQVVSRELFPSALWLDYVNPGYTLCLRAREEIQKYKDHNGCEPSLIILKNHGVFVAADEADEIRRIYAEVIEVLKLQYKKAGIPLMLAIAKTPNTKIIASAEQLIREVMQDSD